MKRLIVLIAISVGIILTSSASPNTENLAEHQFTAGNNNYYVGADRNCDFSTIQAGIDATGASPNPASVYISYNKTYHENLIINHHNIQLDGSYADCTQARLGLSGRNKANNQGGTAAAPVVHIRSENVSLKNMIISDHMAGGVFASRHSNITLENMAFNLLGTTGSGAINLPESAQVHLLIKDSDFSFNTSDQGSAINCKGSNHTIEIVNTSFSNNEASRGGNNNYVYGGAIFVDGCDLAIYDSTFQNNSADYGGGIYLESSQMILRRATFNSNTATQSSGALLGSNSTIDAEAVQFNDNQSGILAGAIGLSNSTLNLTKTAENCTDNIKCNHFSNNQAGFGAGALGAEFGFIDITGTYFENNRADHGTVLYLTHTNYTKIEGSIFVGNGDGGDADFLDQNVFFLRNDAVARISYSTFADNNIVATTFSQSENAQLKLYSSIVYDPNSGNIFNSGEYFKHINCLIAHEDQSFNTNPNDFVTVADPMFVDPDNGNYHIDVDTSPAVDYCTDTIAFAEHTDIDNQLRGLDNPNVINNPDTNGIFDIGADEAYDLIFANGFE